MHRTLLCVHPENEVKGARKAKDFFSRTSFFAQEELRKEETSVAKKGQEKAADTLRRPFSFYERFSHID